MKNLKLIVATITLAVVMSSCDCFLMWLFTGEGCFDDGVSKSIVAAVYDDLPAAPVPGSNNNNNERGTPIRQEIVGPPTSSEPGGGDNNDDRDSGSSFADIISNPIFTLSPSMSWLGGDKEEGEKFPARPGFQLGAFWQIPLTSGLNLEPGLQYANRGVGYKSEESGYYEPGIPGGYSYSYEQNKRLHYIELPVFVGGQVSNSLGLFGGPQVGFLIGAKVVNESNGETTSTEKGTKGFNKVDFGLAAGARYQIPNSFFSISLNYYNGLSNLTSESSYGGYGNNEPKYLTRAARLGIQYNFGQARKHAASAASKNSFRSWMGKQ